MEENVLHPLDNKKLHYVQLALLSILHFKQSIKESFAKLCLLNCNMIDEFIKKLKF